MENQVILVAVIGLAVWIAVSIFAALLFGRMVMLNKQDDLSTSELVDDQDGTISISRIARDRVA
jgi:hypothetical protein